MGSVCRDLDKQPVEDSTKEWKEDEAPFARVATVTVEPQDSWSDENVRRVDEEMRFSIWTGLSAHRPLGNINRGRKDTYIHSSNYRASLNKCPVHEPGVVAIPGSAA